MLPCRSAPGTTPRRASGFFVFRAIPLETRCAFEPASRPRAASGRGSSSSRSLEVGCRSMYSTQRGRNIVTPERGPIATCSI